MKNNRPELDEYLGVTVEKAKRGECEGSCESHSGEVSVYRVYSIQGGFDWGYFAYCETAKDEDVSRGMELEDAGAQA